MRSSCYPLICLALCISLALFAETPRDNSASAAPFAPNVSPTLKIQRISAPITIDGDLEDIGWLESAQAGNFTETFPGDQVRPPVDTRVMIGYDDKNLYVAFIADDNPSLIRATMRDRDEIWQDDYVGLMLDTYGDGAMAYEIFINPYGVQGDLRISQNNEDASFDMIFKAEAQITSSGYQIEMAIPFSSLRFPDKAQHIWRANFWRNHPRDSRRRYSWAAISRDDPCFACQWGSISGIADVKPGNNLELLPSVVGFQSGALADSDDPTSNFTNSDIDGDLSIGVKYSFTPSVSVEGTINPDFSQVESDAAQVDVNTTFALSFPERRPFFQEGSDIYATWIDAIYTRSINDPSVAGKLTGRNGRTSFGYIGARDINTPQILPFEEESRFVNRGKSFSNIFRLRQTFSRDSYVGVLLTDRRFEGSGSGSAAGIDGQLRFLQNYQLGLQVVGSRSEEPGDTTLSSGFNDLYFDNGKRSAAFDAETFSGNAIYASVTRDARFWDFDLSFWQYSPTFRADNGFVFQNNSRRGFFYTGLRLDPDNKVIDSYQPSMQAGRIWNFNGTLKDEWLQPTLWIQFKKQTSLWTAYLFSSERYQGAQYNGIQRFMLNLDTRVSERVTGGFWMSRGNSISRRTIIDALGKNFLNLQFWSTIKPFERLIIEPSLAYETLEHPDTGEKLFEGYIVRTRMNYQFTRAFFLRLVVQYNNFSDRLDLEPLLTYRLNPFSIFYIGSTNGFEAYNPNDRSNFTYQSRQVFFKFQYLFQR